jgi:hypothetical protein
MNVQQRSMDIEDSLMVLCQIRYNMWIGLRKSCFVRRRWVFCSVVHCFSCCVALNVDVGVLVGRCRLRGVECTTNGKLYCYEKPCSGTVVEDLCHGNTHSRRKRWDEVG